VSRPALPGNGPLAPWLAWEVDLTTFDDEREARRYCVRRSARRSARVVGPINDSELGWVVAVWSAPRAARPRRAD
jgi:hypothetical protein